LIHRHLARICASRSTHVAYAGRMLAWSAWAVILLGVFRQSAAPAALDRFDIVLTAWWVPENVSGFLLAAASLLIGVALWACAKHFEHGVGDER
jgi:hypothetical protein